MDEDRLYDLVKEFYGYKCAMRGYNSENHDVFFILYNSFWAHCGVNEEGENFYASIETGSNGKITRFLGKTCSKETDEESIKESLQIIDDYCRLRLPDKFLKAYDEAYAAGSCES